MKLSTKLNKTLAPELLEGRKIKLIVDCASSHTADNLEDADTAHRALLSVGCTPLWQESPVVSEGQITIHYTTTNYKKWCNSLPDEYANV